VRVINEILELKTETGIQCIDLNRQINAILDRDQIRDGFVNVFSRHTTTALTVNENEERLLDDISEFLEKIAPATHPYKHNDLHLRDCPPDEPENAHSHLSAMMLGNSETIPVLDGKLALGTYQSIMLVELDGPRDRTVHVQVISA